MIYYNKDFLNQRFMCIDHMTNMGNFLKLTEIQFCISPPTDDAIYEFLGTPDARRKYELTVIPIGYCSGLIEVHKRNNSNPLIARITYFFGNLGMKLIWLYRNPYTT